VSPGDRLVRAGACVFAVGLLAVVVAVVPFLVGSGSGALVPATAAAVLLPLGLGLALLGVLRSARTARRAARRSSSRT
jgi:VIT1/CCC1 family predicted Fe2+/Mn2+ transporter